jgi:TPR repeat protein
LDEARQWLEILANPSLINVKSEHKDGYVPAQYILGNWYMSGSFDIQQSPEKAFELYLKASEQHHPQSTYLLGKCYQDGVGTISDQEAAVKAYQKASSLGESRASYVLGMAYVYGGIGLETNPQLFLGIY